jgi:hypothetical protein
MHKEDITIYKIYAKVKGRVCCMAINEQLVGDYVDGSNLVGILNALKACV